VSFQAKLGSVDSFAPFYWAGVPVSEACMRSYVPWLIPALPLLAIGIGFLGPFLFSSRRTSKELLKLPFHEELCEVQLGLQRAWFARFSLYDGFLVICRWQLILVEYAAITSTTVRKNIFFSKYLTIDYRTHGCARRASIFCADPESVQAKLRLAIEKATRPDVALGDGQ